MHRFILILLFAGTAFTAGAEEFEIHPFREAVVSVRDGEQVAELLTGGFGWLERDSVDVGRPQMRVWRLPATATARQWLLMAPGTDNGYLRLVQFDGVKQQLIRPFDQAWDTGGLFDVNVRTDNLEALYGLLAREGWHAVSEPVHIRLPGFEQKQWFPRSPDGLRISPIERVPGQEKSAAPRAGSSAPASRAFNATQIVADLEAAIAFYRDVLGFELMVESLDTTLDPGPNVFGLPYNLLEDMKLPFAALSADGSREGTLELISFERAEGRHFAERAVPPNLGMLALRFPVTGLEALHRHLREHDVEIIAPPTVVTMSPFGLVQVMAVRGPEGLWLEFFE